MPKELSNDLSRGVIGNLVGCGYAQRMAEALTERLSGAEREAGFLVYLREGSKPPGVNLRRRQRPPDTRKKRR
jgi:hypothetical protein